MTDLLTWLRATIEANKTTAEVATKGEWASDDGGSIHVGHPTDVVVDWILGEENLAHVLLQQPRDTIARCEAELLLLDEHPVTHGWDGDRHVSPICQTCSQATQDGDQEGDPYPCRTIRLLAHGYRHRPGWNPDWAPEGMTL